jgi:hypothetical protein
MFDNFTSKAILDLIRPGFQLVYVAAVDTVSHLEPHCSVMATTSLAYDIVCLGGRAEGQAFHAAGPLARFVRHGSGVLQETSDHHVYSFRVVTAYPTTR